MIKLYKGDCLEVMKDIESGSVDAIITDPPYGTTACKWDSVIPFDLMWGQLNRIIKPNGAIVLFGSEPFSSALRMSNIKNYKYDWYWKKDKSPNFLHAKNMPHFYIETISIFYKLKPTYYSQPTGIMARCSGNKKRSSSKMHNEIVGSNVKELKYKTEVTEKLAGNVITISNSWNGKQKRVHPTQKPIELMEYLIKTYTNENETVLDFTMGSGTTMVACQNTNRNGIGIEQDDKYFDIAEQRIKENEYKLF